MEDWWCGRVENSQRRVHRTRRVRPPPSQLTATSYFTFTVCLPLTCSSSESDCHGRWLFVVIIISLIVFLLVPYSSYFFPRLPPSLFHRLGDALSRSPRVILQFR